MPRFMGAILFRSFAFLSRLPVMSSVNIQSPPVCIWVVRTRAVPQPSLFTCLRCIHGQVINKRCTQNVFLPVISWFPHLTDECAGSFAVYARMLTAGRAAAPLKSRASRLSPIGNRTSRGVTWGVPRTWQSARDCVTSHYHDRSISWRIYLSERHLKIVKIFL